jgi:hypothetical protein
VTHCLVCILFSNFQMPETHAHVPVFCHYCSRNVSNDVNIMRSFIIYSSCQIFLR